MFDVAGCQTGINMLLKLHGDVVGIVGVTGEPEKIRDFAKLVKMTAELTIEQAALVENFSGTDVIAKSLFWLGSMGN